MGTAVDDVALGYAELLLDALVDCIDHPLVGIAVDIGKTGDGLSIGEKNHTEVSVVEDTVRVPAQLILGGSDVDLCRSDLQLATHVISRKGLG